MLNLSTQRTLQHWYASFTCHGLPGRRQGVCWEDLQLASARLLFCSYTTHFVSSIHLSLEILVEVLLGHVFPWAWHSSWSAFWDAAANMVSTKASKPEVEPTARQGLMLAIAWIWETPLRLHSHRFHRLHRLHRLLTYILIDFLLISYLFGKKAEVQRWRQMELAGNEQCVEARAHFQQKRGLFHIIAAEY